MSKIFLGVLIVFFLLIASIYFFIPSKLRVAKVSIFNTSSKTLHRCLTDTQLLHKMMKREANLSLEGNVVRFEQVTFQFKEQLSDYISVPIEYKELKLNSVLSIVDINSDTSGIEWRTEINTSYNPLKRIQQYYAGKEVKNYMATILQVIQKFVIKNENIYVFKITRARVTDTLLISTKVKTKYYPTQIEYYNLIKKLQDYVNAQGANTVNYPMLNITPLDSIHYETMVALPVNKILPDRGNLLFKKMVAGNVLTTEIQGGRKAIDKGFNQLTNYATDHSLVSPAISYESLVTNRIAESDSSRWVTKIYTPVF